MEKEQQEKFQATIDYFEEMNIQLPTEVRNAVEDVFNENDDIDSVEIYHKEDLEILQSDLKLKNNVILELGKMHHGTVNNVWTYYGGASFSLSEKILLLKENGDIEEEISNIENDAATIIDNPTEYSVILHEVVDWDIDGDITRVMKLYIYCPESGNYEEGVEYGN